MFITGDYIEEDNFQMVDEELTIVEPVSWHEIKAHLRLWSDDEQDLVMAYVHTARIWAEKYTQRAMVAKEVTMYYDDFSADMDNYFILKYPIDMEQPFVISLDGEPLPDPDEKIQIRKGPGYDYISVPRGMITGDVAQLTIDYVAEKYGRTDSCKPAIMLMAGRLYSSRESLETRAPHNAVKNILNFHRIKYK